MFRSFTIAAADLLVPEKRAAFDKSCCDFERDVEKAECGIMTVNSSMDAGVYVLTFYVKKLERVMTPNGSQKVPLLRADEAEFEKAVAAASKHDGAGVRVLR